MFDHVFELFIEKADSGYHDPLAYVPGNKRDVEDGRPSSKSLVGILGLSQLCSIVPQPCLQVDSLFAGSYLMVQRLLAHGTLRPIGAPYMCQTRASTPQFGAPTVQIVYLQETRICRLAMEHTRYRSAVNSKDEGRREQRPSSHPVLSNRPEALLMLRPFVATGREPVREAQGPIFFRAKRHQPRHSAISTVVGHATMGFAKKHLAQYDRGMVGIGIFKVGT
ncbi:hypothetical protein EV127DRAFT_403514 [Xylaria flabelliformis]|nr:hypothetical protein EV127DRAFT_403514 [Xylaria flabelliformis]